MNESKAISLSTLINCKVHTEQGVEVGVINEVWMDPSAGIVRYVDLDLDDQTLSLPWAAMVLNTAQGGYTLTHLGTSIYIKKLNELSDN